MKTPVGAAYCSVGACGLALFLGCIPEDSTSKSWLDDSGTNETVEPACGDELALELFERRIEPLFDAARPKSCNQCHLAGLDFSVYVQPTMCQTFACMEDRGLVSRERPDDSLILSWIGRAKPTSGLITERVIEQEREAFSDWIRYNARCELCAETVCEADAEREPRCAGEPEVDEDFDPTLLDTGDCSSSALEQLFQDTVYSSRGRCSPCHFSDAREDRYDAPRWLDVADSCAEGAARSFANVIERDYINLEIPSQSLLLLKPLPEKLGGVPHEGHAKLYAKEGDPVYRSFLHFAERYVSCEQEAKSQ